VVTDTLKEISIQMRHFMYVEPQYRLLYKTTLTLYMQRMENARLVEIQKKLAAPVMQSLLEEFQDI